MNSSWKLIEVIKETPAGRTLIVLDHSSMKKMIVKEVSLQASQVWIEAFRREVDVLEKLDSTWVPSLIEQGCDGLRLYLCETYLEGISLDLWLKKRPSAREKREVFIQVIRLIDQVHQAGYLYLDLKGENVLIHHGHACLIDFNSCLPIGSTRPSLVSRESLPPEGALGHSMNEAADQIGLGHLWMKMSGPSLVCWTALAKNPVHRFRSLESMIRSVRKSGRIRLSAAFSCGLVMAGAFLPFGLGAASSKPKPNSPGSLLLSSSQLPDAAALCELYARQEEGLQPVRLTGQEWLIAAKAAIRDGHLGLAGYLQSRTPDEDSFALEFSSLMLRLLLGESVSQDELESLAMQIPEQSSWKEQMTMLFQVMSEENLSLSDASLSRLCAHMDQTDDLDPELAQSFICYLLDEKSRQRPLPELSDPLKSRLEQVSPEFWRLFVKSQGGRSQGSKSENLDAEAE